VEAKAEREVEGGLIELEVVECVVNKRRVVDDDA
jgi:hypothetical protein